MWNSGKKGLKIFSKQKILRSSKKISEKLTNWRGLNNVDNKYCDNNGGTFSRCD